MNLSATFDNDGQRAAPPQTRPKYVSLKGRRKARCDECFVLQHENPQGQRINTASYARNIRKNTLYLCNPHTLLWKERDAKDESDAHGPRVI